MKAGSPSQALAWVLCPLWLPLLAALHLRDAWRRRHHRYPTSRG